MRCPSCSTDNDERAEVCAACGKDLEVECAGCGSSNRAGARFCGQCAAPLRPLRDRNSPAPPAERRQITVVFCDLVNSTAMSERLDPEDWRDVLREYHARCAEIVRRFDGYIAQYLGDGLLIYFGYPLAHEDSPRRAVRAALALVKAVGAVSPHTEPSRGVSLQVRVGIHTGPVVMGVMGDAERHEFLAVGETPNVAARVQGAATPNSVLVSEATYRLTKGYFTFQDLGPLSLKGLTYATTLYEVGLDKGIRNRLDVGSDLTPLVGRELESAHITDQWARAINGEAPTLTLRGEPGIGKSRLVRNLRAKVEAAGALTLECYGSPLFQGTALHPIVEMIEGHLSITPESSAEQKVSAMRTLRTELERLRLSTPDAAALLASLLSIANDGTFAPIDLSPQKQRQSTFDTLVAWLHALTAQRPVLFVFEDLQWADPSTLEFLGLLIQRPPPGPLLLLLTHRPEFTPPWTSARLSQLDLLRMPPEETLQILKAVLQDKRIPREVEQEVLAKADGVPLYVEEITKAILESPALRPGERPFDTAPASTPLTIPATVRDSLTARLDRLGTGKPLVQLGATLGRTFRFELLRAVSGMEEIPLRHELQRLTESELLFRGDQATNETYTFKHALIQDAAYASLLRSTRQGYHRQVARVLTNEFPELANAQPELLAHHFVGAAMAAEAIQQWMQAGQRAIARSAYHEAQGAFTRALEQLETMPGSRDRDRQEIEVRSALGFALFSTRGYAAPEVEANYAHASELCERCGDQPVPVLYGIWGVQLVRSDLDATARLAALFERATASSTDPLMLMLAYGALGVRAFYTGSYGEARRLLARAEALCDIDDSARQMQINGFEGYLYPILYSAWCDVIEGHLDRARERLGRARSLADKTRNPYAIAMVLSFDGAIARDSNNIAEVQEVSAREIAISLENGFPFWLATASVLTGWAESMRGNADAGIKQIEMGIGILRNAGCFIVYPYYQSCMAEALLAAGRPEAALEAVNEALSFSKGKLASNYVPNMLKLKGDILAASHRLEEAEVDYRQSLAMLRQQGARLFELRAAVSLARLLASTSRAGEARTVLGPVCDSFGESIAFPEFQVARSLFLEFC